MYILLIVDEHCLYTYELLFFIASSTLILFTQTEATWLQTNYHHFLFPIKTDNKRVCVCVFVLASVSCAIIAFHFMLKLMGGHFIIWLVATRCFLFCLYIKFDWIFVLWHTVHIPICNDYNKLQLKATSRTLITFSLFYFSFIYCRCKIINVFWHQNAIHLFAHHHFCFLFWWIGLLKTKIHRPKIIWLFILKFSLNNIEPKYFADINEKNNSKALKKYTL